LKRGNNYRPQVPNQAESANQGRAFIGCLDNIAAKKHANLWFPKVNTRNTTISPIRQSMLIKANQG
jgi:hypothetical protein